MPGPAGAVARGEVLVVGSVNADFVVRVERLPRAGETVAGGVFEQHHGGKGANQAVAAARVGARVTFVGAVGDDELGRAALAELVAERVEASAVATLAEPTGVALIVVDRDGENQIAVASGANSALDDGYVTGALAGMQSVRGSVLLLSLEVGDAAIMAAARHAHAQELRIVVNPAPARRITDELLDLAPILLPNALEAAVITRLNDADAAARALTARTRAPVIVTLGADGALLADGSLVTHLPAPRVTVVDTTGAGDTFCGAFAAELSGGAEVAEAARFAIAAAALSVTRRGARGGMPTRAEMAGGPV